MLCQYLTGAENSKTVVLCQYLTGAENSKTVVLCQYLTGAEDSKKLCVLLVCRQGLWRIRSCVLCQYVDSYFSSSPCGASGSIRCD